MVKYLEKVKNRFFFTPFVSSILEWLTYIFFFLTIQKQNANIFKEYWVIHISVNYISLYNFYGPNSNVTQKPGF